MLRQVERIFQGEIYEAGFFIEVIGGGFEWERVTFCAGGALGDI
jgi:hypothetical protein